MPGALVELAEQLQRACLERGLSVAVAESCTGGLIAAAITEIPGSSGYFLGGVVSYANEAKARLLAVPAALLAVHGAVSAEVAAAMAAGVQSALGADLAASVTGVAGPDGGTTAKPVGLTYIALADERGTATRRLQLEGDRSANREAAARAALEWLLERASR